MPLHWADQLAEKIAERAAREGGSANVKCQQTPSGGKHIGNLNDVARAFFPYRAAKEKGVRISFVHTTDDRDPLKDVPAKLPDLSGAWHSTKDLPDFTRYLGHPLCRVPDPFACCKNWSEHFTKVWMAGVNALGMEPELHSVNALYESGKMEPFVRRVFERAAVAGEIVAKFQATKAATGTSYIPFDAICPNCGVLTNIDSFDLDAKTVHFVCGGKTIKAKRAEGCGKEGTAPWSEGKLQWRFEWPAMWALFKTTFEPFGKDHAEGSWKSGQEIAKRIFDIEPPIPFVYEFFLVNGEKMSASKGNVYIVQDLLQMLEPEAFLFYYTKRPEMQRDLDLSRLFALADDFDAAERVYFGADEARNENREENAKRMYALSVPQPPAKAPNRVSYSFAAALIQVLDEDKAVAKLKELGHLGGTGSDATADEARARTRLGLARNWIASYAADEFKIAVLPWEKAAEHYVLLSDSQKRALAAFADEFEKNYGDEAGQGERVKAIAVAHALSVAQFFEAAYRAFFGKPRGPKLVPFLNALEKTRVAERLRGKA